MLPLKKVCYILLRIAEVKIRDRHTFWNESAIFHSIRDINIIYCLELIKKRWY